MPISAHNFDVKSKQHYEKTLQNSNDTCAYVTQAGKDTWHFRHVSKNKLSVAQRMKLFLHVGRFSPTRIEQATRELKEKFAASNTSPVQETSLKPQASEAAPKNLVEETINETINPKLVVTTPYIGSAAREPATGISEKIVMLFHKIKTQISPYTKYAASKTYNKDHPYEGKVSIYGGDNTTALAGAIARTLSPSVHRPQQNTTCKFSLVAGDTIANASILAQNHDDETIGVVNCANAHRPGGVYGSNKGSQEEALFYGTNIATAFEQVHEQRKTSHTTSLL